MVRLIGSALDERLEVIRVWEHADADALIAARGKDVVATLTIREPIDAALLDLAQWCTTLIVAARGDDAGLITAELIDAIGPDGLIVKIARWQVIDEDAMIAALRAGRPSRAALDVVAEATTGPERQSATLQPRSMAGRSSTRSWHESPDQRRPARNVATRLHHEDERVKIWEMKLEPSEQSPAHERHLDHVNVVIKGDQIAGIPHVCSAGASAGYIEADIHPGQWFRQRRGGVEVAKHRSQAVPRNPYRDQ